MKKNYFRVGIAGYGVVGKKRRVCIDSNSNLKVATSRGCVKPFIFKHNYLKMPSRLVKLVLYTIIEKLVRLLFIQSKGVLSANLEVVITKK